jgi:hypothetical protein
MSSFQAKLLLFVLYKAVREAEEGSIANLSLNHRAINVLECPKMQVFLKISGRLSFIQRILASEHPPETGMLAVVCSKDSKPIDVMIFCA